MVLVHQLSARVDNAILRQLQGVICHGPYLVDQIGAAGVASQKIVEFDVDFADYESAHLAYAETLVAAGGTFKDTDTYLLFVGRLEVDKGIIDFLQAAAGSLRADKTLRLQFAGDGNGRDALEQEIRRLGLQQQVTLLGRVAHSELVPLFANARAIVAPNPTGLSRGSMHVGYGSARARKASCGS